MLNSLLITFSLSIISLNKIVMTHFSFHSFISYLKSVNYLSMWVISSLLFLQSPIATALPEDRDQPMDVVANDATLDDKTGITTLRGAVKVLQGTMTLTADILVIHRDKNGDVSHMVATGNPAFFSQQQQVNEPLSKAWGKKMNYSVPKQTVTITENARVEQAKDKFTGQKIVYHMDQAIVEATGGKQRVKMVIQPKGKQ